MKKPSLLFNYLEVVATIDADGILGSLNIFSAEPDNLKDLACKVNKQTVEKLFNVENDKYVDNYNAIMMDYIVYHDLIKRILSLNKIKSSK